ncbi:MAG: YaaL family protein [Ectobacillus sp.]
MFFRRKGYLRREYDEKLIQLLEDIKQDWMRQKRIVEQSVEPSEDVICQLKIAEAKYFYMLKEAKQRQVKMMK